MSLLRQLVIAITLLVMVLLAGNLIVSVVNARVYFFAQMNVHAQDTATALGFSISQAAQEKDAVLIGSMIDVIFDRGYYRQISYRDLEGKTLVSRDVTLQVDDVPAWFVDLIEIPEPQGESEVINGWFRLGKIEVVAHTGLAYRDLWRVFREQLWLFLFTAVAAYGLAGVSLHFLLRPLKRVEKQADAICRREFPEQQQLPRTRELRSMVQAMNRMVEKIKDMFQEQLELTESLHRSSHVDFITGLSNRLDFDARLESFIKSELGGGEGALLLWQLSGMQTYNESYGREAGDLLLRQIADVFKPLAEAWPGAIVSRRGGTDFCIFIPAIERVQTVALCEDLVAKAQLISWPEGKLPLYLGVVHDQVVTLDSQLLSRADAALRIAQHQVDKGWHLQLTETVGARPAGEWRQLLERTLSDGQLALHYQPVYDVNKQLLHAEVLVRMNVDGQLQHAGSFLPMVERFALVDTLDRRVLEMLAQTFQDTQANYCVNLSPRTIALPHFRQWLKDFLSRNANLASRLVIEVSENVVLHSLDALRDLVAISNSAGAKVSLDHFGVTGKAFNYLQSLPLHSLKIDRSFITNLHSRQDNQFFVKSLAQIAHSCDMILLAEGVETEQEWQQVGALGLDGAQGYYLGRPAAGLA
ncbi:LapD/MoxY N-terminal periplasmic domain-containing protein [Simiduia litorea]